MRILFHAPVAAAVALALACAGGGTAGGTADVVTRIPFASGERLVYALHDDTGAVVGHGTLVTFLDGGVFSFGQEYQPEGEGYTSDFSVTSVDAGTLKPLSLERVLRRASDAPEDRYGAIYAGDGSSVRLLRQRDGEAEEERELRLREHAYDNESSLWLWRTLDLSDSYEARYVSVNHAERSQQTVILRVTGRQTVDVPAGEFDSWRLQVRNGRATRVVWIEVDSSHRVVQWDNGSLVFRLESISDDASRAP